MAVFGLRAISFNRQLQLIDHLGATYTEHFKNKVISFANYKVTFNTLRVKRRDVACMGSKKFMLLNHAHSLRCHSLDGQCSKIKFRRLTAVLYILRSCSQNIVYRPVAGVIVTFMKTLWAPSWVATMYRRECWLPRNVIHKG